MKKGSITIGTAGHIDHGKSSLVMALTGTDPDRFIEEKERGMTIDLGFAFYNERIAFVDVPGHEKFIKNMVAGVIGIHIAALVIAVDDGIMPQTLEHLKILQLLGIKKGFIVLTKTDLVEAEWLDMVEEDIRSALNETFLSNARLFRFSAVSQEGLDEIKSYLDSLESSDNTSGQNNFRYYVDRVFSQSGFGTVVTGTVNSGFISTGDKIEINPGKHTGIIRGIQIHNVSVDKAELGSRAALNISGIKKDEITRGTVLSASTDLESSRKFLIKLFPWVAVYVENNQRVRLLSGTKEVIGRIRLLTESLEKNQLAYFISEELFFAFPGDRFILRSYSPMATLSGGEILFPLPESFKMARKKLHKESEQSISQLFIDFFPKLWLKSELEDLFIYSESADLKEWKSSRGQSYILTESLEKNYIRTLENDISNYHKQKPWSKGKAINELSLEIHPKADIQNEFLTYLLEKSSCKTDMGRIALKTFSPLVSQQMAKESEKILTLLEAQSFTPPAKKELFQKTGLEAETFKQLFEFLIEKKAIYAINSELFLTETRRSALKDLIKKYFAKEEAMKVADFSELLSTSRKYAIPFLEYSDKQSWTLRAEDIRKKGEQLDKD